MKLTEFASIIGKIALSTGKSITPEAQVVYYELLGDLPADVLALAAQRVILEHRWANFPTVAELRAAAVETMRGRIEEISPAEAWRVAWSIAERTDLEQEGSFDRACAKLRPAPIVLEAMRCYGIPSLFCNKENVSIVRAQFIKIFEQLTEREKRSALLPPSVRQAIEAKSKPSTILAVLDGIGRSIDDNNGKEVA